MAFVGGPRSARERGRDELRLPQRGRISRELRRHVPRDQRGHPVGTRGCVAPGEACEVVRELYAAWTGAVPAIGRFVEVRGHLGQRPHHALIGEDAREHGRELCAIE